MDTGVSTHCRENKGLRRIRKDNRLSKVLWRIFKTSSKTNDRVVKFESVGGKGTKGGVDL